MKKYYLLLLFAVFSISSFCQDDDYYGDNKSEQKEEEKKEDRPTFLDRCYTGGNFSLSLGTYGSYVEVSPVFGYNLTDKLSIGVSTTYKYFSGNNPYWGISYRSHVYGGSAFARLLVGQRFLAQAEIEMLNTEVYDAVLQKLTREFIPVGLVGAGFRSQWSDYSYSYFLLMYDLIRNPASPYPFEPFVIKIGVAFPVRPK